ncbi:MAG TPA: SDR family oxidoreductase, partial [Acidimicrobiales bacterium]|nr:SDR family oxidoreductase [Acidimicrobiales bacterium]
MTFEAHPERRPAVVTGASSGIGAATARLLGAAGHPVVLGARRLERCEEEAAAIRHAGGEATAVRLDLADAASVAAFAAAAVAAYGEIDILVSNAGDVVPGTALGTDPDAFAEDVTVNFLGPQRLCAALVPAMVDRAHGDVVLVSSSIMRVAVPGMAAYATAKAGLDRLGHVMRMELEGTGVRVSTVRPGPTLTGMGMDWQPELVSASITTWVERGLIHGQH